MNAENTYRKNVEWLKVNIPRDEIYEFTEQSLIAAEFFLHKWNDWVDVAEECRKDKVTHLWVSNILGIRRLKEKGFSGGIQTNIDWIHD